MSQVYVILKPDGSYKYETVTGFVPKDAIIGKLAYKELEPTVLEDVRWVQLEQIVDPISGEIIPTFTVDAVKKAQVIADDLALEAQKEADKLAKDLDNDAFIDSLIAFDPEVINDLAGIKEGFRTLKTFFDYYFATEIKAKKDKDKVK